MNGDERDARSALLNSFSELVLNKRYHEFGVGAIIEKAKVARSTFYYHFTGKDELLLRNLQPMIAAMAGLALSSGSEQELQHWISHLWQHRAVARRILEGPAGRKLIRALAAELQVRLPPLLAHQIAAAMFGLLQAWISGCGSGSPGEIAEMMKTGAKALANGQSG